MKQGQTFKAGRIITNQIKLSEKCGQPCMLNDLLDSFERIASLLCLLCLLYVKSETAEVNDLFSAVSPLAYKRENKQSNDAIFSKLSSLDLTMLTVCFVSSDSNS